MKHDFSVLNCTDLICLLSFCETAGRKELLRYYKKGKNLAFFCYDLLEARTWFWTKDFRQLASLQSDFQLYS